MRFIGRILFEIFRFPIVTIWKLTGWRISKDSVEEDKIVLTGTPHTSNWDYLFFLLSALTIRRKVYVTIKSELFFPPLGWLLKALGGIPIDRSSSHNLVEQLVERLNDADRMLLLFTPDGTRSYRPYWKTGFYWVAKEAGVPIMLAIANYQTRSINIDHTFMPSGDIEADFEMIRELQEQHGSGLYPDKANPVLTRQAYEASVMVKETDISAIEETLETEEDEQAEKTA